MSIAGNNQISDAGKIIKGTNSLRILAGNIIKSADEIKKLTIKASNGRPVYVEDVAIITDGVTEPDWYHHSNYGPASKNKKAGERQAAVTLSFSKKKGTNAVKVAQDIIAETSKLRNIIIPEDVDVITSRKLRANS